MASHTHDTPSKGQTTKKYYTTDPSNEGLFFVGKRTFQFPIKFSVSN